ncbi:MAG: hypothetical protein NVS9B14_05570 [Candidatus Acidiferrum sp.]
MARKLISTLLALSLLLPYLFFAPKTRACGPFFTQTIFTLRLHPDFPLTKFAAGDLRVLQPTYARSYLVVAFRILSGNALTPAEQRSVQQLWQRRMMYWSGVTGSSEPAAQWILARRKFTASRDPDYTENYRKVIGDGYAKSWQFFYYENCLPDAFSNAAATLKLRAARLSASSSELKDWIAAQDAVFSYCGVRPEKAQPATLEPLGAHSSPTSQADRLYQIASLHFYQGDFVRAEIEFSRIAADVASPWHDLARLLAVRARLRKATVKDNGDERPRDLAAADRQLQTILSDSRLRRIYPAAKRLKYFVDFRLNPEGHYAYLASQLMRAKHVENFGDVVGDYTIFLDQFLGDNEELDRAEREKVFREGFARTTQRRNRNELTDWIVTFQSKSRAASQHAIDRWKESHSLPWLVAALAKSSGQEEVMSELLEAADLVDDSSPAFPSIAFHRNRLRAALGNSQQARTELDSILASKGSRLTRSSLNMFLALRMTLAHNFEEWLSFTPRVPTFIGSDESDNETPDIWEAEEYLTAEERSTKHELRSSTPRFDADTTLILNEKIPLSMLQEAAQEAAQAATLSESFRRQIAQAVWVRMYLLNASEAQVRFVPVMRNLFPQSNEDLNGVVQSRSPDELRFTSALSILKRPGWRPNVEAGSGRETLDIAKIDSYRDNWWCSRARDTRDAWPDGNYYEMRSDLTAPLLLLYPTGSVPSPEYLSNAARDSASEELSKIQRSGAAVRELGDPVLNWAAQHPEDPRVPAALHYLNRADRYGCSETTKLNYSKLTFQLLHKHYPNSEWTKKTPYWF